MPDFCHLHTHSQYSLLDGASRIGDLIKRAMAMGQKALAITDHGNLFGAIEFYKACQDATKAAEKEGKPGIKPVIGIEAYITPNGASRTLREKVDGETDYHCLLWAENLDGYQNLIKLSSSAYAEGFYMHPRIDREILSKHAKGVLGSSGCLSSEIPCMLLKKGYEDAKQLTGQLLEIYGKDNFYFEVQNQCGLLDPARCGDEAQELARLQKKVNEGIIRLAREFGGKLIATNDSHYTSRDDAQAHDALLCIGTGKLISDVNRLKFAAEEFYLKSGDEMAALFAELPEALSNTIEVAERCNVKLKFGAYHYPIFKLPPGVKDEAEYFRKIVYEGLKARYGEISSEVKQRAEEELRVLAKMGFVSYLLIVWDIVREAKARGIPVGPGRGSAAGSLACYALGITDLCPLRYQLLFERFVNEGRNEMPDIDIDFCQSRRAEIIEYVQDKYGRDCTAGIITFNSMAAKAAIRDLGRVLDWPLPEVDKVAKLVPVSPGKKVTLKPRKDESDDIHAVDDVPELQELYKKDEKTRTLIDLARRIEGLARNPGRHAAGMVIADKPVTEYCPLYRDKDGALLTQYEMNHIDTVGLLKIDFLGLETLTVLELCVNMIKERHGKEIDLGKIPLDDAKAYKMLSRGEAKGIFQFESEGMIKMLAEARPDRLEDLIALNAMYRPGPMDNIPSFVSRKHGREDIKYLLPQLEPILKETYGIIVYQEQVMQIANQLAGFSLSEADSLRKAMGKKKKDLMEKYGAQFVEGCAKNKIDKAKAQELYDLIAKFASYGFNKSHSAAYAYVAYQTAWLKANYAAEYMAALLSLEQGDKDKVVEYIEEARRIGLEIAGPDVSRSLARFAIESDNKTLRFSLGGVKGVGEKAVESIVAARKEGGAFRDLHDFCERIDSKVLNKGALESLVRSGALDSMAGDGGRGQLFAAIEEALVQGASARQDRAAGQGSLFGGDAEELATPAKLPPVADWPEAQRLEEEKKVLGFYFSGHPLAQFRELVEGLSSQPVRNLNAIPDGYEAMLGAYIAGIRSTVTRSDGKPMAVLTVEDFTGQTQVVVFPRTYERYKELLKPDTVIFVRGKIKQGDGGVLASSVLSEELFNVEQVQRMINGVVITLKQEDFEQQAGAEIPVGAGHGSNGAKAEEAPKKSKKKPAKESAEEKPAAVISPEEAHKAMAARLQSVAQLLKSNAGRVPVWFQVEIADEAGNSTVAVVKAGEALRINPTPQLLSGLRGMLPRGSLRITSDSAKVRKAPEPRWKQQSGGG